jgi:hypothetical protein
MVSALELLLVQELQMIIFPRFTEAAAGAEVLSYFGSGQMLQHRSLW